MSEPFFKPWVGENYHTTTPKILVLGESHYGKPHEYKSEFTQWVIQNSALGGKGSRKFFTTIAKILSGKSEEGINPEEKYRFWQQVVFYNYIQIFVSDAPRVRPKPEMWAAAVAPFKTVVEEFSPNIVIVLGKELGWHIQQIEETFPQSISFCYWTHPSAFSFKKQEAIECFNAVKSKYGA